MHAESVGKVSITADKNKKHITIVNVRVYVLKLQNRSLPEKKEPDKKTKELKMEKNVERV